jgi:hypothetical protein
MGIGKPAKERISLLESAGRAPLEGPYVELNLSQIEACAHRARAEYLGGLLRRFFNWLERDAARARQRRIERYLAGATDLADFEQRVRTLARREEGLLG